MKIYLYLLLPFFLFFIACKEENKVQLPPATQEGKGVLGCLVNGEIFVAQGGFFGGVDDLSISVSRNQLGLGCSAYGDDTEVDGNLNIYLSQNFDVYSDKTFPLISDSRQTGRFLAENGTEYRTGQDKYEGEFTITKLDTVNYIIAGTFWFDAVSDNGEVVEIREGRFDIKDFCCLADPRYK